VAPPPGAGLFFVISSHYWKYKSLGILRVVVDNGAATPFPHSRCLQQSFGFLPDHSSLCPSFELCPHSVAARVPGFSLMLGRLTSFCLTRCFSLAFCPFPHGLKTADSNAVLFPRHHVELPLLWVYVPLVCHVFLIAPVLFSRHVPPPKAASFPVYLSPPSQLDARSFVPPPGDMSFHDF